MLILSFFENFPNAIIYMKYFYRHAHMYIFRKVHEAQKLPNISIVNPKWLFACVERWERVSFNLSSLLNIQISS